MDVVELDRSGQRWRWWLVFQHGDAVVMGLEGFERAGP